jgi:hypothetical protein
MRIDIVEKAGITVDGNQVRIGDSIETAKKILGKYDVYMNDYYFLDGDLFFSVDNSDIINEIEVRGGGVENIHFFFKEKEIFKVEKAEALDFMSACNGEILSNGDDREYYADNLGLIISFGFSEEDVEEMIRESKEDGVYEDMLDAIEQDIYRSKHIEAIVIHRN